MTEQFRLFGEKELRALLEKSIQSLVHKMRNETDDYVLNVSATTYKEYLLDKYTYGSIILAVHRMHAEASTIRNARGEVFNSVRYCIPFEGDVALLRYRPSRWKMRAPTVIAEAGCVCFDVANLHNDAKQIKREADNTVALVETQIENVNRDLVRHRTAVEETVDREFSRRKQEALDRANVLAALGVPIRMRENVPQTFAIPTPKKRKRIGIARPVATEAGFSPEPTLDQAVYEEILRVVHDMGKQFERMPSTYEDKDEEQIRDHLLVVLEAWFVGSATGETFNRTGKTDILLRHEGKNAFIAECRIWRGQKDYLEN